MLSGPNLRSSIILLTSALCLAGWYAMGSYQAWSDQMPAALIIAGDLALSAAVWSFVSGVLLLGLVPLLVVKLVLRERLADYGLQWGDLRFALICSVLAAPLLVGIGYFSAQSPAFQAVYPLDPLARQSGAALAWHIVGQLFWLAAWEFHFRGFLQHGVGRSFGAPVGVMVQMLASVLAHFGKPGAEVFGSIVGGLLWGALAWRTRSLLASTFQHWLLGASLDIFLCLPIR